MTEKTVVRVEKHVIKSSDEYFHVLIDFCKTTAEIFFRCKKSVQSCKLSYQADNDRPDNKKWIRYKELDKILKADKEYPDYQDMPTARSAQQILRLIDKNWKAFFVAVKDWSAHKEKYSGKPKLPKYLKKNGNFLLILTNQDCKLKNAKIYFPKVFQGFMLTPKFMEKENFHSFQQIRLIPKKNRIIAELVYNIKVPEQKPDNQRYIGIDIGVDNLVTVCNHTGEQAFIINGRPLKSINQYYNNGQNDGKAKC